MSMQMDSGSNQDFDLNLAPIIDCMTVLIAFMLASTAFLSIGILDAGVAAAGAQSADHATPPAIQVAVELGKDQAITLKVTGKTSSTQTFAHTASAAPGTAPGWNHEELRRNLTELKRKWPELGAVTLSADNHVSYEDVVKAMEVLRQTTPAVLLGGF